MQQVSYSRLRSPRKTINPKVEAQLPSHALREIPHPNSNQRCFLLLPLRPISQNFPQSPQGTFRLNEQFTSGHQPILIDEITAAGQQAVYHITDSDQPLMMDAETNQLLIHLDQDYLFCHSNGRQTFMNGSTLSNIVASGPHPAVPVLVSRNCCITDNKRIDQGPLVPIGFIVPMWNNYLNQEEVKVLPHTHPETQLTMVPNRPFSRGGVARTNSIPECIHGRLPSSLSSNECHPRLPSIPSRNFATSSIYNGVQQIQYFPEQDYIASQISSHRPTFTMQPFKRNTEVEAILPLPPSKVNLYAAALLPSTPCPSIPYPFGFTAPDEFKQALNVSTSVPASSQFSFPQSNYFAYQQTSYPQLSDKIEPFIKRRRVTVDGSWHRRSYVSSEVSREEEKSGVMVSSISEVSPARRSSALDNRNFSEVLSDATLASSSHIAVSPQQLCEALEEALKNEQESSPRDQSTEQEQQRNCKGCGLKSSPSLQLNVKFQQTKNEHPPSQPRVSLHSTSLSSFHRSLDETIQQNTSILCRPPARNENHNKPVTLLIDDPTTPKMSLTPT